MKLIELNGDLFEKTLANDYEAIAHCISEDCRMGKGIALNFKRKFGGVDELQKQVGAGKKVGKAAVLDRDGRLIFYLITKKYYYNKPTYDSLESSLRDMKEKLLDEGIERVAMPRIGCGLDQLKWDTVKTLIERVFDDTNIEITIYCL